MGWGSWTRPATVRLRCDRDATRQMTGHKKADPRILQQAAGAGIRSEGLYERVEEVYMLLQQGGGGRNCNQQQYHSTSHALRRSTCFIPRPALVRGAHGRFLLTTRPSPKLSSRFAAAWPACPAAADLDACRSKAPRRDSVSFCILNAHWRCFWHCWYLLRCSSLTRCWPAATATLAHHGRTEGAPSGRWLGSSVCRCSLDRRQLRSLFDRYGPHARQLYGGAGRRLLQAIRGLHGHVMVCAALANPAPIKFLMCFV